MKEILCYKLSIHHKSESLLVNSKGLLCSNMPLYVVNVIGVHLFVNLPDQTQTSY